MHRKHKRRREHSKHKKRKKHRCRNCTHKSLPCSRLRMTSKCSKSWNRSRTSALLHITLFCCLLLQLHLRICSGQAQLHVMFTATGVANNVSAVCTTKIRPCMPKVLTTIISSGLCYPQQGLYMLLILQRLHCSSVRQQMSSCCVRNSNGQAGPHWCTCLSYLIRWNQMWIHSVMISVWLCAGMRRRGRKVRQHSLHGGRLIRKRWTNHVALVMSTESAPNGQTHLHCIPAACHGLRSPVNHLLWNRQHCQCITPTSSNGPMHNLTRDLQQVRCFCV